MMSENKLFKLSKYVTPSSVSYFFDENGKMLNKEVVKVLNKQQATINRLEEENERLSERLIEKRGELETLIEKRGKLETENVILKKENEQLRKKLEQIYSFKGLNCRCVNGV